MNLPTTFFGWIGFIWEKYSPLFWKGTLNTLILAIAGTLIGFLLGLLVAIVRTIPLSKKDHLAKKVLIRIANALISIYIEVFRGTPMIVQAMVIYYGAMQILKADIPAMGAAIFIISLNTGAYMAEIMRGGILAIDKGQTEAGRSTGLTQAQTMLYIIWPQAFRRMIPPLTNQCIISLKDTSLLVVIGVGELTRQGQEIIAVNFRAFEVWLTVAIFYLAMTLSISAVLRYYERKLMIGRRAVPASPSDPQM